MIFRSDFLLDTITARVADEPVYCQAVPVTTGTEYTLGLWIAAGTAILGVSVLTSRPIMIGLLDLSPPSKDAARRLEAIIAATLAYGFYVGAALMAGAAFPAFMRDHLFDGFAPAALAGLLVGAFPREKASEALPRIQRPIWVVVLFAVAGAMIFGVIGAAAVFVAGSSDFWPAAVCGALGGGVFVYGYRTMIVLELELSADHKFTWWIREPKLKWWFKKRSADTVVPSSATTVPRQEPR